MNLPTNKFKQALANGERQIGLWSSLRSNVAAEIIGGSGFDWILIDMEHATNEIPDLVMQMQAIGAGGASAIVRPPWNDMVTIKRVLDSGAQSLLIPYVQNVEEAKAAVASTRYPPHGVRGAAGAVRGAKYGRVKNYLHEAASQIAVLVQVETASALEQIEEIAAVDGVDGVFIGPSDLSASMGHLGNAAHPEVQEAIEGAAKRLQAVGKPGGILAYDPDVAKRYIGWGFQFVAVGSDAGVLLKSTEALAAQFK